VTPRGTLACQSRAGSSRPLGGLSTRWYTYGISKGVQKMNAKPQSVTICCLLMASFLLSACSLGELLVPTSTPTSTSTTTQTTTPTSTPTLTKTPTPTPDLRIIDPENQHLYLYVDETKMWHSASDYCLSLGGHLVSIESMSENKFVYNLSGGTTWLGASDEVQEGTWVWTSGQPFDFSYWNIDEPTNCCPPYLCGGTVCTPEHYLTFLEGYPTWNDVPDDNTQFTCEWEPTFP